jgi:hypothetical protein
VKSRTPALSFSFARLELHTKGPSACPSAGEGGAIGADVAAHELMSPSLEDEVSLLVGQIRPASVATVPPRAVRPMSPSTPVVKSNV